jgi:hypothetical protein
VQGKEFNREIRKIAVKFKFDVTGVKRLGKIKQWGEILSGDFEISDFKYVRRGFSEDELMAIKEKEQILPLIVSTLFGYPAKEFEDILESRNPYGLPYRGVYNKWFEEMMDAENPYQIALKAGFYVKNMEFLSGRPRNRIYFLKDYNYYFPVSLIDYEVKNDRKILEIFSNLVKDRISYEDALRNPEELKEIQKDVFDAQFESKSYNERTISKYDFIKSLIIPSIEAYMGFKITDKKGNFTELANAGPTYAHALYWLGKRLAGEEERAEAIKKVIDDMGAEGLAPTLSNFINWITKIYDFDDLKDIYEDLKAHNFIRKTVPVLFGKPQLTYQEELFKEKIGLTYQNEIPKQGIGDYGFLKQTVFDNAKNYLLSVYDPKSYLIWDNWASKDASVMALGFAVSYLACLYKEGLLTDKDIEPIREENRQLDSVKEIIKMSMQTLLNIQEAQPKAEWIDNLFSKYSLDLVEYLFLLSKNRLRYPKMDELNSYLGEGEKLGKEEYEQLINFGLNDLEDTHNWELWIKKFYIPVTTKKIGKRKPPDSKKVVRMVGKPLIDEDIYYIKQIKEEEIEKIKKYGWGGWLYHFYKFNGGRVDVRNYERKEGAELTPLDTVLTAMGFYIAGMVFPELKDLALRFIDNLEMDGIMWNEKKKRYWMAWQPQAFVGNHNEKGFTLENYIYRSQEELALEFTRALWARKHPDTEITWYKHRVLPSPDTYNVRGVEFDFYDDMEIKGMPEFYPALNGPSWVFSLIPLDLRGADGRGTDWYIQSILGNLYNRIASLMYGYRPYEAQVGSMEILGKGYDMGLGLPPLDPQPAEDITGLDHPSTIPDGTPFSIYSLNLSALPGEALFSLWYQYLTNPKNAEGKFGFRASFNRENDFWATGYYTFDIVTFGLNALNALHGTVWDLFSEDEEYKEAMKRLGYDVDSRLNDYKKDITEILPFVNEPLPTPSQDASPYELYDAAEAYIKRAVDIAKHMTSKDPEDRKHSVQIFRYYLDVNDMLYENARRYLADLDDVEDPELKTKIMALEFVINKNQFYYERQKELFGKLTGFLSVHPEYIDIATDIVSNYDYEAQVMWKAWDADAQEFVPVLSRDDIRSDLENPGVAPRTAYYPELEEYLAEDWRPYSLIAEHSGIIAPLVQGTKNSKGFLEVARDRGWDEAAKMFKEEFEIQSALKPYVELLIGRKLDIADPEGKDPGFLAGLASDVKGGLPEGENNMTIEEAIDKLKLEYELLPFVKALFDYLPEWHIEHTFDLTDEERKQMGYLSGWADEVLKKEKSVDEVKRRLLAINMIWPNAQWKLFSGARLPTKLYIPVIRKNHAANAGWVENWCFKGRGVLGAFGRFLLGWIDERLEEGYTYDQLFQAFEVIKKFYGMAPDLNQPDAREEHQKIMKEFLDYGKEFNLLDKNLTEKETWFWGNVYNLMRYEERLTLEEAKQDFDELWENYLSILVEDYGYDLDVFNYSTIEALYDFLMFPKIKEKYGSCGANSVENIKRQFGVDINTTRWEVEKRLVNELLKISKSNPPETKEDKVLNVFKAMQNVANQFGITKVEITKLPKTDKGIPHYYGGKDYMNKLNIAKFDSMYIVPPLDPFVGYQTRTFALEELLLNYLFGIPYYDETAVFVYEDVYVNWY